MENSDGLVPQKNDLSKASETFLTPSEQRVAVEIHLTTLNSKSQPQSELLTEFVRVFKPEPPEAIQWAFEAWRRKSGFFPAISDIVELIAEWKRGEREQAELREQLREKVTLEEARAAGQLVPFETIRERFLEIVEAAKMEVPVSNSKLKLLVQAQSLQRTPPGIHMTKEQIEARRPAEQAECERYRKAMEDAS